MTPLLVIAGVLLVAVLLIRVWTGILNVSSVENQTLQEVETTHPYFPTLPVILVGIGSTVALVVLTARTSRIDLFLLPGNHSGFIFRTAFVFIAVMLFGLFDQWSWSGTTDRHRYFFAFLYGTVVTWILVAFKRVLFETGVQEDPFLTALGITCIGVGWRFLFGPWTVSIKATVLGTFIFWVTYAILRHETQPEVLATALAMIVALIPVIIWCKLFLSYHWQRGSVVVLAFFAGMLSTAPILFYNALATRALELNFFLFKIKPVSFSDTSYDFVQSSLQGSVGTVQTGVLTALVTYLIVGAIEETSKYWILRHSVLKLLRSIDDVMELSIIVAIGFAFAENLVNPDYFVGFIQRYVLAAGGPQWGAFLANVVGRAVLTNMVHILSTGLLGYFFGLAFFASPLLKEKFLRGRNPRVLGWVQRMLLIKQEDIFARYQLAVGLVAAIVIHGLFDFVVTLPDKLPGHPDTVGALLNLSQTSLLRHLSITVIPSVLYVIGGMWLLTSLFERKEDMKEYGAIIETQTVVREQAVE